MQAGTTRQRDVGRAPCFGGRAGWLVLALALGLAGAWGVGCTSPPPPPEAKRVVPDRAGEPGEASARLASEPATFSAEVAWTHLEALSGIGSRATGTEGNREAREYLREQLATFATEVREQRVEVVLPDTGREVELVHLTAVLEGASPDVVLLAAHYDTAEIGGFEFVGTNDGASGPALLLELGRVLADRDWPYTVWLGFIDGDALEVGGEPAHVGSRTLAQGWADDEAFDRIRLAVFFGQVCDADLGIARDLRSHPVHREVFWESAEELGYGEAFAHDGFFDSPETGHVAFLAAGLNRVVALTDDRYGGDAPPGIYWHTEQDTPEHCAVASLEAVGAVSREAVDRIAGRLQRIDGVAWSPEPEGAPAAESPAEPDDALAESGGDAGLSPGAPAGTHAP